MNPDSMAGRELAVGRVSLGWIARKDGRPDALELMAHCLDPRADFVYYKTRSFDKPA